MILQCPNCDARFLVDASVLGAEGREVRCAKCSHQWHAKAHEQPQAQDIADNALQEHGADESKAPEAQQGDNSLVSFEHEDGDGHTARDYQPSFDPEMEDIPDFNLNIPDETTNADTAKTSVVPVLAASVILFMLMGGTALLAFKDVLQPMAPSVYEMIGIPYTQGLKLADVTLRKRETHSNVRYIVEGKIVNESDEVRKIPTLRVAMINKAGTAMQMREYEAEQVSLKPGESYPFSARNLQTTFVDRVSHLVVDLGNGIELGLRDVEGTTITQEGL